MAKTRKAKANGETSTRMPVEEFVRSFLQCATNADVTEKLGAGALSRAARLRKKGVELPALARAVALDEAAIAELNEIIAKAQK